VPEVLARLGERGAALFVKVEDLDAVVAALEGADAPVVVPRRTTFYDMDELFVAAPCGTVVGFAGPVAAPDAEDEAED
jgi:hypothetical protein